MEKRELSQEARPSGRCPGEALLAGPIRRRLKVGPRTGQTDLGVPQDPLEELDQAGMERKASLAPSKKERTDGWRWT